MIKTTMELSNIYNRFSNLFPKELDTTRRSNLDEGKEEVKRLVEYDLQYITNHAYLKNFSFLYLLRIW